MKWVEPVNDFLLYFGRTVSLDITLDNFFCGTQASQEVELKLKTAKKDKVEPNDDEEKAGSWEHTLSDSSRMHLQMFRDMGFETDKIWDLDHNPAKRPRTSRRGGIMQTLTSHGTLWSERLGRPLTALETVVSCPHVRWFVCMFVRLCIAAVKS